MLAQKKDSPAKTFILLTVVVVILGVIIYLLLSSFGPKRIAPGPAVSRVSQKTLAPISPDLGDDLLGKSPYTELKQFGPTEVKVGSKGRRNPFSRSIFARPQPVSTTTSPLDSFGL